MIKDPWRMYISLVVSELFRDPYAPKKTKFHIVGFFGFVLFVFTCSNTCFHCSVSTSMGNWLTPQACRAVNKVCGKEYKVAHKDAAYESSWHMLTSPGKKNVKGNYFYKAFL